MQDISQSELLYKGKAKSIYKTENSQEYLMHFRNDISAFDGVKLETLEQKGAINHRINTFIMKKLEEAGIKTHILRIVSDEAAIVRNLNMIPLECVVRNYAAGGLCKRLGVEEGRELTPPTFELFLKNDDLHDPLVNMSVAFSLGFATLEQMQKMKDLTFAVNSVLLPLFDAAGILLVDYKLEFGEQDGEIYLADEFSPDGCRLWDKQTKEKLDKDRFRHNLADVLDGYRDIIKRLEIPEITTYF